MSFAVSSVLRFGSLALAGLATLACAAACSVTGTGGGFGDVDASAEPTVPSGPTGPTAPSGDAGADAAAPSCADPTCPREICQCTDKSLAGTAGVCRTGTTCDVVTACKSACGSPGFSGSSLEYKPCKSAFECETSQPGVSCTCQQGFGENANAVCKDGYCSFAPQDACPAACASEGGWAGCMSPADCAPLVCACKDGSSPAAGASCNAGACGPASGQCPALCASRGGWSGTATVVPDAGPPGPKQPGDACHAASECSAFDCSCNNGMTYKNNRLCESQACATKAEACGFVCQSSGGWSGT